MKAKTKRNIYRILPFGVVWLVFGFVYIQLEKGFIGNLGYYPATGNPYNFVQSTFITITSAAITGLLIGTIEILYFHKLFMQKSFSKKIVYKSLIYLALIVLFLIGTSIMANFTEQDGSLNKQVWNNVSAFFFSYAFLSVGIYMAAIIIISQFYTEVSDNMGQHVLTNFFTGKYHTPKEEERIFMFLDMKSSTTIAESLGHARYFEILRSYYTDLSDPIIKYAGEIYQYVGDEIVVSWKIKNGVLNNNCIQCFFAMKEAIKRQSAQYQERFGLLPQFKAGFHVGKVTTGEIGALKKDIIFTGDVLNTTARIQALCNTYHTELLLSYDLIAYLTLQPQFNVKALGEASLRGREEKIKLYTVLPVSEV